MASKRPSDSDFVSSVFQIVSKQCWKFSTDPVHFINIINELGFSLIGSIYYTTDLDRAKFHEMLDEALDRCKDGLFENAE